MTIRSAKANFAIDSASACRRRDGSARRAKIVWGIFLILFSFPKYLWANIGKINTLNDLSIILSSRSRKFQEHFNKNITLINGFTNRVRNSSCKLVNQSSIQLFARKDTDFPILDITHKDSFLPNNYLTSIKGKTKIMKVKEYYKVKKGDNLWLIARRYKTTEKKLIRLNNLKSDLIHPGQKLLVAIRDKVIEIPYVDEKEIKSYVSDFKERLLKDEMNGQDIYQTAGEKIVEIALKYLGVPYKYGGETLWGMDCSAFVRRIFRFFSLELPRSSKYQYNVGEKVPLDKLKSGDLVFFRQGNRKSVSHVGIYIGNNKFIHASGYDKRIVISDLSGSFYRQRYKGACRIINFLFPSLESSLEPAQ